MSYFTTIRKVGKLWQVFINVAKLGPIKYITTITENKKQFQKVDLKLKLKQRMHPSSEKTKCFKERTFQKKERS